MSLADGERHVSLSQMEKILVSTMPPRQLPDMSFGRLSKLGQKLGVLTAAYDRPRILTGYLLTARGICEQVLIFFNFR